MRVHVVLLGEFGQDRVRALDTHRGGEGDVVGLQDKNGRVRIDYRALSSGEGGRRTVDPWGLVLAWPTWYLLAAHRGRPHTYRVSRIASFELTQTPARRPARLDLQATWRHLRSAWQDRPGHTIELRVEREQADLVQRQLQFILQRQPAVADDGPRHRRIRAEVSTLRGAVGVLLGFGTWVEVLDPPALRDLMADVSRQVVALYQAPDAG